MTWRGRRAAWQRMALAFGVGAVLTALVGFRVVEFGVNSPAAHLVLNSLDGFIALLVAFLVHGRFLRRRQLRDLLLSQGLFLSAVAGLGLSYVGRVFPDSAEGTVEVWLPLTARVLSVALLAAAALAGERVVDAGRRHRWPLVAPLAAVAVAALLLWWFGSMLPVAVDVDSGPRAGEMPLLTGHWLFLVAQAVGAACFLVAAAVFTKQAATSQDELLSWLGPAFVLGGFARLNFLLFPSLYTDWLYTGDVLRTGCHLLLLVGATREIQQHWHAQTDVAVLEDRRRLARELHDGVVQELGYIKATSHQVDDGEVRDSILTACDRALDEARAAVHALGTPAGEPLAATIERAVRQLTDLHPVTASFNLSDEVTATPDQRHALVRIAREAVNNAVRHGKATQVRVTLTGAIGSSALSVGDDGTGFDVPCTTAAGTGYGLTSMHDRAAGLPGSLSVESAPGRGCEVTVRW